MIRSSLADREPWDSRFAKAGAVTVSRRRLQDPRLTRRGRHLPPCAEATRTTILRARMDKAIFSLTLVGIGLRADHAVPMHASLYQQLRELIASGRVPRGIRLPSTRMLADQLGCSRPTVIIAYEHLESEGYLASRQGSGTFVADSLPEDHLPGRPDAEQDERPAEAPSDFLSRRGTTL